MSWFHAVRGKKMVEPSILFLTNQLNVHKDTIKIKWKKKKGKKALLYFVYAWYMYMYI